MCRVCVSCLCSIIKNKYLLYLKLADTRDLVCVYCRNCFICRDKKKKVALLTAQRFSYICMLNIMLICCLVRLLKVLLELVPLGNQLFIIRVDFYAAE